MLSGVEASLDVDTGVAMSDDVPQTDRSLQGKSRLAIDDAQLLEAGKALRQRGGRRPTFVSNQVAREIGTHLNR